MIGIIAKLKVKDGRGAEFKAQTARMSFVVERDEPGCVFYRSYTTDDPDRFVALELYEDQAAVDAHGAAPHTAAAVEEIGPMLDGDLDVIHMEQVW